MILFLYRLLCSLASQGCARLALALLAGLPPTAGLAAVFDEFEVHGTALPAAGSVAAELFTNYGLRGRRLPDQRGALAGDRGAYATPLLGYGVTGWWEAAVLMPMVVDRQGRWLPGGAKLHHLLALPHGPGDGWSFGAVVETSILSRRFQPRPFGWEVRPLAAYAGGRWSARLTLGFEGSLGRRAGPSLTPSAALHWAAAPGLGLGLEHYADLGPLGRLAPPAGQAHQLFCIVDVALGAGTLRLGLGRGLTPASEAWVATAQIGFGL